MSQSEINRTEIIEAVKRPINFMVLVLLMVEILLGAMAFKFEGIREQLVWVIISFFAVFTLIVIVLGIWRPEVLQGTRNWDISYSDRLADNIYIAIEGYFENLSHEEKVEAWMSLSDFLKSENSANAEFDAFCVRIGSRIAKKAQLNTKQLQSRAIVVESI
ncbi:hypothetical protein GZH53_15745 [Flavihumibacter sp. R14]|nr:hypothetical protein [Flavihumibacter soli]